MTDTEFNRKQLMHMKSIEMSLKEISYYLKELLSTQQRAAMLTYGEKAANEEDKNG